MKNLFKPILLFLIGMMLAFATFSQAIQTIRSPENKYTGFFRLNPKSDGVKGTPFLFDIPPKGNISLSNGNVHDQVPFNIFLETNTVYIQTGDEDSDPLALKNWEWVKTGELDERLFRMESVSGKPQIVEILFENNQGKYVAVHSKTLVQPSGVRDGYTGPQYDTFKHSIKYLFIEGMESTELKTSTSALKDLAGDRYNDLKDFMKSNKLKPENPIDLRKILIFLFD